jgi:hypothetical protein
MIRDNKVKVQDLPDPCFGGAKAWDQREAEV